MKIDPALRNTNVPMDSVRAVKKSFKRCIVCGICLRNPRAGRCQPCGDAYQEDRRTRKAVASAIKRRIAKAEIIAHHLGISFETHKAELLAAVVAIERHVRKADAE